MNGNNRKPSLLKICLAVAKILTQQVSDRKADLHGHHMLHFKRNRQVSFKCRSHERNQLLHTYISAATL